MSEDDVSLHPSPGLQVGQGYPTISGKGDSLEGTLSTCYRRLLELLTCRKFLLAFYHRPNTIRSSWNTRFTGVAVSDQICRVPAWFAALSWNALSRVSRVEDRSRRTTIQILIRLHLNLMTPYKNFQRACLNHISCKYDWIPSESFCFGRSNIISILPGNKVEIQISALTAWSTRMANPGQLFRDAWELWMASLVDV